MSEIDNISLDSEATRKVRNKDLTKTKLCVYAAQGQCTLGDSCPYAHSASELREAPNLTKTQLCSRFMNGKCANANCNFAHGEAELVKPPNFKKKMCYWHTQGKCRNGSKCGFAHSFTELAPGSSDACKMTGSEYDYDASTDVPSSKSLSEIDATTTTVNPKPHENLFRMMASRGSAPLQQQVQSMGLAISELQGMLAQVADKLPEAQAQGITQDIKQLSKACGGIEDHLRTAPDTSTIQEKANTSSRIAATEQGDSEIRRRSYQNQPPQSASQSRLDKVRRSGQTLSSKQSGSRYDYIGDSRSMAEPATGKEASAYVGMPSHTSRGRSSSQREKQDRMRWALGLCIIMLMVLVEMHFYK